MSSMAGMFNPSSFEDFSNMINMSNLNNQNLLGNDKQLKSPQNTNFVNLNSSQSQHSVKNISSSNSNSNYAGIQPQPQPQHVNPNLKPGGGRNLSETSFLGNKTKRDEAPSWILSNLSKLSKTSQQRNILDDIDITESSRKNKKISQKPIENDSNIFSKRVNTKILSTPDEKKCLEEASKKSFAQKLNEMQVKLNSDEDEERQLANMNPTTPTASKFLSLIKPHSNTISNQSFQSFNPRDLINMSVQSTETQEESIMQGIIKLFSENFTEDTLFKLKGLVNLPEETVKLLRLFLVEKNFPKLKKEYIFLFRKENESSGLFLKIDSIKKKYSLIKKKILNK